MVAAARTGYDGRAADDLEQALISGTPRRRLPQMDDNNPSVDIIERTKTELQRSARRAPELAILAGMSEKTVKDAIKRHPDIFQGSNRGWLTLKEQES